jgi:hypothetical protein
LYLGVWSLYPRGIDMIQGGLPPPPTWDWAGLSTGERYPVTMQWWYTLSEKQPCSSEKHCKVWGYEVTAVLWVEMSGNTHAVTQHYNPDNTLTPTPTPTPNTPGEHGIHVMWFFCEQIHCVQQRTSFSFHVAMFNVLFLVLEIKSILKF